jgi:DNA-binding MarR family transcriptional regulator
MQRQHRLKPEEIDELVHAYKAGELIKDLADRFSIHRSTVMAHLQRRDVRLRGKAHK